MEVKVVNTEVKPPFVCFTMEGLSAMGYRHTESPTKSGTQREMFRSDLSNKYQNAKIQNTNTNTETQKVAHR